MYEECTQGSMDQYAQTGRPGGAKLTAVCCWLHKVLKLKSKRQIQKKKTVPTRQSYIPLTNYAVIRYT